MEEVGKRICVLWKFWVSHRQAGHGCGDRQLPYSTEETGEGAREIKRLPLREQSEQNQRNMRETQSTQCFLQSQVVWLQKAQEETTRSDVTCVLNICQHYQCICVCTFKLLRFKKMYFFNKCLPCLSDCKFTLFKIQPACAFTLHCVRAHPNWPYRTFQAFWPPKKA